MSIRISDLFFNNPEEDMSVDDFAGQYEQNLIRKVPDITLEVTSGEILM